MELFFALSENKKLVKLLKQKEKELDSESIKLAHQILEEKLDSGEDLFEWVWTTHKVYAVTHLTQSWFQVLHGIKCASDDSAIIASGHSLTFLLCLMRATNQNHSIKHLATTTSYFNFQNEADSIWAELQQQTVVCKTEFSAITDSNSGGFRDIVNSLVQNEETLSKYIFSRLGRIASRTLLSKIAAVLTGL